MPTVQSDCAPRLSEIRMPGYQAFVVGHDDTLVEGVSMLADSDADALALARDLMAGHVYEVWDGLRLVARIENRLE